MTFQELREYLDSECGCTIEPLEEGLYLAKNCIKGKVVSSKISNFILFKPFAIIFMSFMSIYQNPFRILHMST